MIQFPEKCNNCPFTKCRTLHYFNRKRNFGITSRDIERFYENYLTYQGKSRHYDKSTPRKILERLRKSRWLYREFKRSRNIRERGRLPWVHFFDKKAKDYLREYKSFLVGPLCRKNVKERAEKKKTVKVKPKIKEEIIVFGIEND